MALLFSPYLRATDQENAPIPGAFLSFYATQTSNPQPIYADAALTIPLTNPVPSDGNGVFPVIWLNDALPAYKAVLQYPDVDDPSIPGAIVAGPTGTIDPYNANINASGLTALLLPLFNPITHGEQSSGLTATDINFIHAAGDLLRYGENTNPGTTTPGTSDMASAFQKAIDAADAQHPAIRFADTCAISKPLLIRSASVEGLALLGDSRTISIIEPFSVTIGQAAQGINALIINQCDNGHFQLRNLRFLAEVPYTGYIMYSLEGGCVDGSGQAAFSMVLDNVWCSLSAQNSGYFRGGFSNLKALNMVYESVKDACWILEGAGNSDQQFIGHQMFICFDNFIRASDSNDKAIITVDNLHAYSHLRGRLIEFNKGHKLTFSNIVMEPDAANLGDCGLFKFTDCDDVLVSDCSMAARTGVPAGAVGIELINNFSGKFVNVRVNAATCLKMSGTGAIDVTFVNCDFTDCTTCWDFSGTLSGTVRFIGCKMNNAQQNAIVQSSGTASFDVEFVGGEVLNAGLGGTSGFSNLNITPAGNWVFRGTTFGKNNVSAAAANWVNATAGGGSITFESPKLIGSPPTALNTGTLGVFWNYPRGLVTLPSAATLALPYVGDVFTITGTTGITSIGVAGNVGRRSVLMFQGAVTVTNGIALKLAGATNFTSTADDTLSLYCDGTAWRETGRSVN